MKGLFNLNTPESLVKKLLFEFQNFSERPDDSYQAFNFFVTAEHIPDWIHEKELRKAEPILRICSHLANGAKHFEVDRHHSVNYTEKELYAAGGYFAEDYVEEPLVVYLSEREAEELGKVNIRAIQLAEMIVDYWSRRFPDVNTE